MLGIPREYLNVRRPRSIVHWYKSVYMTRRRTRPELVSLLPVVAQIEPTVRCDLACTFCHSQEIRKGRKSPDMTIEQFKHVVAELRFLVAVGICGMGEPTVHPDFARMVECVAMRGICPTTATNCNHHTPEISKQLVSTGLRVVQVSIDGATPDAYERSRRGARFERTLENLERLVTYRGSRKYPRITVEMLPFDYNYREMPDVVSLCARIGVDHITIQARPTDWGKDDYVEKTLQKSGSTMGEDFEHYLKVAERVASEKGVGFEVIRHLYDDRNRCPKPWNSVYISTTGDVVPCCAIADPRVKSMGNLFSEPFATIWNNKEYVAFRRAIASGKIPRCCFQCYAPHAPVERS